MGVHGAPDYSNVTRKGNIYRLDDMSELATRMGSIVAYDRRGDVLWLWDFKHGLEGLHYDTLSSGAGVTLTNEDCFSPPFCAKLNVSTGINNGTYLGKRLSESSDKVVGFQFAMRNPDPTEIIDFTISHYATPESYDATFRIDVPDNKLKVWTVGDVWVTVNDDFTLLNSGRFFSQLKLVVDLNTHTYKRAMIDDETYLLSEYVMRKKGWASDPYVEVLISSHGNLSDVSFCYVDNLIYTTAEDF